MEVQLNGSRVLGKGNTVSELLSHLGLSREEALVKVNGEIRPEGWKISGSDSIEVIKVVFGG